jgi:hypothetical protein
MLAHFNSTGQHHHHHFDIWLINSIQEIVTLASRVIPDSKPLSGWVNGNLYKPTSEVFEILPVPDDVHQESSMQEFDSNLIYNQHHGFLASKQGT